MTTIRRLAAVAAGAALATGAAVAVAPAAAADDQEEPTGTTPLAEVLLADGDDFDHDSADYDIVTQAVLAVLAEKPDSPVGVLTQGEVAATAFVPNDRAFRLLVRDLTHENIRQEADVFAAVAGLGIDTVETVLLYHVVPGATIDSEAALAADGAHLPTALEVDGTAQVIGVDVRGRSHVIRLVDNDTDDRDPRVVQFDLNEGNVQIAHGINRVLRPVDL
ncbi:MAG: fasciclin domain-containing protein [Kineosporiaceae bacterium]